MAKALSLSSDEVEDILLLCYANYFGRNIQKHGPVLVHTPNNTKLIEQCFTHLQFAEVKKSRFKVCLKHETKKFIPAAFDMQGPEKIFQTHYVNLKKWKTLSNLTGRDGPEMPASALIATRERNVRVLTIAKYFYSANIIPTLSDIEEALQAYSYEDFSTDM